MYSPTMLPKSALLHLKAFRRAKICKGFFSKMLLLTGLRLNSHAEGVPLLAYKFQGQWRMPQR